jgi:hypothetical protein
MTVYLICLVGCLMTFITVPVMEFLHLMTFVLKTLKPYGLLQVKYKLNIMACGYAGGRVSSDSI